MRLGQHQSIKPAISLILGLFPVFSIAFKDGGSALLVVLFLVALFFAWPEWQLIGKREKQWMWSLMAFSLVIALACFKTEDWANASHKIEHYLRFLAIIPIYLLVRRFKPNVLMPATIGMGVAIIILFFQAVFEKNSEGVDGAYYRIFFGDSVILFTVLVAGALWILPINRRLRIFSIPLLFLGLYATSESMCRNAWLLLPVLVPVVLFLYRDKMTRVRLAQIGVGLAVITTALILWAPSNIDKGLQTGINNVEKFMQSSKTDSSWAIRLKLWHDSVIMASRNPLLGVGIGNFRSARQRLINAGETFPSRSLGHAHSIFFHTLATTGLLGLTTLCVALFIMPWRILYPEWKSSPSDPWRRYAVFSGLLCLVAFAHFGMSEAWTMRNPFINIYVLFMVMFVAETCNRRESAKILSLDSNQSKLPPLTEQKRSSL